MITYDKLYVGGQWVAPEIAEPIVVVSPHDRPVVGHAAQATPADVDRAVSAARAAFDHGPWPHTTPEHRQALIARFNELHAQRATEIAELVTAENGTPSWFTSSLQTAMAEQTNAYLRAAAEFGWEERVSTPNGPGPIVRREPVGVVAAVIPWNAPHQSALVKIVPALLAGCAVILNASPETALDALLLAEVFAAAGLPDGVLSILPAHRGASEYLVAHPGVDKVAFTGSTAAGRRIAAIAGEQLKRVSLELGGKSAGIVLADADLPTMLSQLPFASFGNNGESCGSISRLLLPRSRYEEFVDAIAGVVGAIPVGDPRDPATFIGPMVTPAQQERVRGYIRLGIAEGARLVVGGPEEPEGLTGGNYVRPTVFAEVRNDMRIAREEIFGPVLSLIAYETEEEAIRIANDSDYGLSGAVWSADQDRALAVARRLRTGGVLVNGDPGGFDAPFGGYKASGLGREMGVAGLSGYVELKTINA
ncbi:aldehyde dehydrogenase [Crossiella cryophila]|uniref:Acyl-CoA reductase-like NAD-dependent aldehyde dehydrogenase n=1 Tax=Crossiella cryophila TaxID=43355 RepID=A0A7W7FVJ5_9PSEU|nr:aldehyde dehydrogenase [Crossiella cryophila]MBB4680496.1 acyl-CoA reductase-like NAD-dependent aldehyde dehydrogenase [Crossiella cryophila]